MIRVAAIPQLASLVENPTTTAIATGSAVGAFVGGSLAFFLGRDEQLERYAARGSVAGGMLAGSLQIAHAVIHLIGPTREIR